MVSFINQPQSRSALLGQSLGGGIGQGLGQGVQSLIEHKLQNLVQNREKDKAFQFGQAIGLDPKTARAFSMLDPKSRQDISSNVFVGMLSGQPSLEQLSQGFAPQQQGYKEPMIDQLSQSFGQNSPSQQQLFQDRGFIPKQQFNLLDQQRLQNEGIQQGQNQPMAGRQQIQAPLEKNKIAQAYESGKLVRNPQLKIAQGRLEQGERKLQQQREFEEKKLSSKEQREVQKETQDFVKDVNNKAHAVRTSNIRLNRIEKLSKEGNLGIPLFNSFINTLNDGVGHFWKGADLSYLLTRDAQELQKLSKDFARDAKDIFGSRVTNYDLEQFYQMIPTLAQSTDGRLRIINNMKLFNDLALLEKRTLDKVISENNGKRPHNLEELIQARMEPEAEKISAKFISGSPDEPVGLVKGAARTLGLSY